MTWQSIYLFKRDFAYWIASSLHDVSFLAMTIHGKMYSIVNKHDYSQISLFSKSKMPKVSHRWSWFKVGGLLAGIIFFVLFYLITINNTSTKGYFLRQSMRELDDVEFRHNVASFQLAIAKRQLWDKVNINFVWARNPRIQKQESNIIRLDVQE